jgi:hypothetical protein
MGKEEQLLECWRELPVEAQDQVLALMHSLQFAPAAPDFGAPEHLTVHSPQQLDQLLLEGLESGDPITVTDEWWEQKRDRLFNHLPPPQ